MSTEPAARTRNLPSVEEVARVIDPAIYPHINRLTGDGWEASKAAARAVLALFAPETVTTADELDALPVGSVVRDLEDPEGIGSFVFEKSDDLDTWEVIGSTETFTSEQLASDGIARVVIYRPEEDA